MWVYIYIFYHFSISIGINIYIYNKYATAHSYKGIRGVDVGGDIAFSMRSAFAFPRVICGKWAHNLNIKTMCPLAHTELHYADPGPPAAGSLGRIGTPLRNTSYRHIHCLHVYGYCRLTCLNILFRSVGAQGINRRRRNVKLSPVPREPFVATRYTAV